MRTRRIVREGSQWIIRWGDLISRPFASHHDALARAKRQENALRAYRHRSAQSFGTVHWEHRTAISGPIVPPKAISIDEDKTFI